MTEFLNEFFIRYQMNVKTNYHYKRNTYGAEKQENRAVVDTISWEINNTDFSIVR